VNLEFLAQNLVKSLHLKLADVLPTRFQSAHERRQVRDRRRDRQKLSLAGSVTRFRVHARADLEETVTSSGEVLLLAERLRREILDEALE
jgi:hypothetical protein